MGGQRLFLLLLTDGDSSLWRVTDGVIGFSLYSIVPGIRQADRTMVLYLHFLDGAEIPR